MWRLDADMQKPLSNEGRFLDKSIEKNIKEGMSLKSSNTSQIQNIENNEQDPLT